MQRARRTPTAGEISFLMLIVGVIVIGLVVMVIVRVQRGLLGLVLAALAVLLIVYWIRELRKTVVKELFPEIVPKTSMEWSYDLVETETELNFVAEVPGPDDQVKVKLVDHTLEVRGGQGFRRTVNLPQKAEIVRVDYVNKVLNIRMKKQKSMD